MTTQPGQPLYSLICIYKTDYLYPSPTFTCELPDQSPPNFAQTSGKVLSTSLTPPAQPPVPRVPETPKPKQITGEKLCFTKNALNFFRAVLGPGWLVYISKKGCSSCVPLSRANRRTNLHQILYRPPCQLREGSKHKNDPPPTWPTDPRVPQTLTPN